jgi:hypothetical protein
MGAPTRPHSRNLFATIGAMDVATLGSLFTREARVVFGNGAPMVGNDEIRTGTTAFFDTIADLHHAIVKEWSVGDDSIIDLRVTYGQKDGQQIGVPASRSCIPTPPARSTTTGRASTWRPYMPDRRAQAAFTGGCLSANAGHRP